MENQTEYEKERAKTEKMGFYDYMASRVQRAYAEPDERLAHKAGFRAGYELGAVHAAGHVPEAAKKVDRTMIAAMAMQGIITSEPYLYALHDKVGMEGGGEELLAKLAAKAALYYADALIKELEKEAK